MDRDYIKAEQLDDRELTENDKKGLYEDMLADISNCFDSDLALSYEGSFVGVKRIGEETANNIELSVLFTYDAINGNHYLQDFSVIINEISECQDGLASHLVVSSMLKFSASTLVHYDLNYYLYDSDSGEYIGVFIDGLAERWSTGDNLGKSLKRLNKEYQQGRDTLTTKKVDRLLYIFENVLNDDEISKGNESFDD